MRDLLVQIRDDAICQSGEHKWGEAAGRLGIRIIRLRKRRPCNQMETELTMTTARSGKQDLLQAPDPSVVRRYCRVVGPGKTILWGFPCV